VLGEQGVCAAQDEVVDQPAQLPSALLAQRGGLLAGVCIEKEKRKGGEKGGSSSEFSLLSTLLAQRGSLLAGACRKEHEADVVFASFDEGWRIHFEFWARIW
jgi:hypothetical protein